MGQLIPLFCTSGDICPRFQRKGGSIVWMLCCLHAMDSTNSPLVQSLLTSWWSAWQLSLFLIHVLVHFYIAQVDLQLSLISLEIKLREICLNVSSYIRSSWYNYNQQCGSYTEPHYNLYSTQSDSYGFARVNQGKDYLTGSHTTTLGSSYVLLPNAFLISSMLRHWRGREMLAKKLVIVALADGFAKTS